jgi:ribose transport system permease protein
MRFGVSTVHLTQERVALILTALIATSLLFALPGFGTTANLLGLLRSVSVLGILGIGMSVVIIGRGIDLSMVATMAISVAWYLELADRGHSPAAALTLGLGSAVLIGCANGLLIAYAEVPALFATLAMGILVYGIGRSDLLDQDLIQLPDSLSALARLGNAHIGPIPIEIVLFAALTVCVSAGLKLTKIGRFIYLMGDNMAAARITGVPTRPLVVGQYVFSSVIAFVAGIVTTASLHSMNTRIVNSTLLYDSILVVVIGGIGLSGGKGGMSNVLVGTLLIGILLNGMTILDISDTVQNVLKAVVLLTAILVDSLLNPRDEQTAQQGDI